MPDLLERRPAIVNVGIPSFVEPMVTAGASVVDLAWQPPGTPEVAGAVASLTADALTQRANDEAFRRFTHARPLLLGVARATEAIIDLGERTLLHAGPPIAWEDMAGPMRGAIIGAILHEGWADRAEPAADLAASGEITFAPAHHYGAVGAMAGVISPSMPVWIVENTTAGNRAFSNLNEGLGRVLRFGAYSPDVLQRLAWMGDRLLPALDAIFAVTGPIELKPIAARALHMGDELHNRNAAASALLYRQLSLAAITACSTAQATEALSFIADNDHFFLNISMAMCKSMLDAAHGVQHSSFVTAMARNGVNFGVRLSGTKERWFEAPAPTVDGLFFTGYGVQDAAPDLGDSAITETAGLGGFAMAASPAIVRFVGGSPDDATSNSRRMRHITMGSNTELSLPQLDFAGTPSGIDAIAVVDTSILPVINTGIAHRDSGVGQIGAGVTQAPREAFEKAVVTLAAQRRAS
jgi:hypothetical protein